MNDQPTDPEPFHLHLEQCAQCRLHPFDLCPVGDKLLCESVKPSEKVKFLFL